MTDRTHDHRVGERDPAKAFEALRQAVTDLRTSIDARQNHLDAKMTITRESIEAACGQLAAIQEPVDYSAGVASLLKALDKVERRAQAIGETAALQRGQDDNHRILIRAGEAHIQSAAESIKAATRDVDAAAGFIDDHLRSARNRQTQDRKILAFAAASSVFGGFAGLLVLMLNL